MRLKGSIGDLSEEILNEDEERRRYLCGRSKWDNQGLLLLYLLDIPGVEDDMAFRKSNEMEGEGGPVLCAADASIPVPT